LARTVVDDLLNSGGCIWTTLAISVLVEALLQRGDDGDLDEAASAIDQLAAVPTNPGFVLNEISLLRLRALLAHARGEEAAYRDHRDRYRAMATSLGFEGHIKWAAASREEVRTCGATSRLSGRGRIRLAALPVR
jgi:adenylate cyclase